MMEIVNWSPGDALDASWKAWAAAVIDGEGSIYLATVKDSPSRHVGVAVYNTDIDFLKPFAAIANSRIRPVKRKKANLGKKVVFSVHVTDLKARKLLVTVLPFLIAKRQKAIEALAEPRRVRLPGKAWSWG